MGLKHAINTGKLKIKIGNGWASGGSGENIVRVRRSQKDQKKNKYSNYTKSEAIICRGHGRKWQEQKMVLDYGNGPWEWEWELGILRIWSICLIFLSENFNFNYL
jgi:hypothetical protein